VFVYLPVSALPDLSTLLSASVYPSLPVSAASALLSAFVNPERFPCSLRGAQGLRQLSTRLLAAMELAVNAVALDGRKLIARERSTGAGSLQGTTPFDRHADSALVFQRMFTCLVGSLEAAVRVPAEMSHNKPELREGVSVCLLTRVASTVCEAIPRLFSTLDGLRHATDAVPGGGLAVLGRSLRWSAQERETIESTSRSAELAVSELVMAVCSWLARRVHECAVNLPWSDADVHLWQVSVCMVVFWKVLLTAGHAGGDA
jgi:hypothetical protein